MPEIATMTADLIAKYAAMKIPSVCHRCEAPVLEGAPYTGGGIVLMCIPCAIKRAQKRVIDAEIILSEEKAELAALYRRPRIADLEAPTDAR